MSDEEYESNDRLKSLVIELLATLQTLQEKLDAGLPKETAETLRQITQRQVEWVQAVREIDIRLHALEALPCHRQYIGTTRN